MSQRKYSVDEIDRMRAAVRRDVIRPMEPYRPEAAAVEIEQRLRTYMENGTDPEELEARGS